MPSTIKLKPEVPVRETILPIPEAGNPLTETQVPDWTLEANSLANDVEMHLPNLEEIIQRKLQEVLERQFAKFATQPPIAYGDQQIVVTLPSHPVEMHQMANVAPKKYKKHYRCDASQILKIQALDMRALDADERPQAHPLPGEWITFHRGHLYTNDDNTIRQIEWMKDRAAYSSDGLNTLGGNPSIYEDDGGDIFRCTAGCGDFVTASRNSWRAHMRATHQVEVE